MDNSRREGEGGEEGEREGEGGGRRGEGGGGGGEHRELINIPTHHFTSCFLVLNLYFSCHLLSITSSLILLLLIPQYSAVYPT